MNHAPHLRAEDRPDFGRTLDDALRDSTLLAALHGPEPLTEPGSETRLTAEQLRTKALFDQDTIAAAAADEYRHYSDLRDGLRRAAGQRRAADPQQAADRHQAADRPQRYGSAAAPSAARTGPQTTGELLAQLRQENGGGPWPLLTVLVPMLAVGAAVVLLLIGYALSAADAAHSYAHSVVLAGWAAVAVAAASLVVGLVGLVLTALRDSSDVPQGEDPDLRAEVAEARAAWLHALRERAILPYLLANLGSEPAIGPIPARRRPPDAPEFSSPGYTSAAYGSPGFSSPGVEGLTDPEGQSSRPAEFSRPGYSPPGFTGPDEV